MRYIWLLAVPTLLACGADQVAGVRDLRPYATPDPGIAKDAIAAWGDSFTESAYPIDLEQMTLRPVYGGGVSGQTSTQILARILADTAHREDIQVFWMGRNNFADAAQVLADIRAAFAHHVGAACRCIVLSIMNGDYPDEQPGSLKLAQIQSLDDSLRAIYPQNYLDVRSMLVGSGYVTPPSLRSDELHLNGDGYYLVALWVQQFIDAKHW